jgi:cytoskeletal protein RodZ
MSSQWDGAYAELTAVLEIIGHNTGAAQWGGITTTTGEVSVPRVVIVGGGIVGLIVLAFVLRQAVQTTEEESREYEIPENSTATDRNPRPPQQTGSSQKRTQSSNKTDSSTTRRAFFIGGIGAIVLVGIAVLFSEQTTPGPDAAAEEFISAIDNSDFDMADSMIHPDSPIDGAGEAVDLIVGFTVTGAVTSVAIDALDISAENTQVTRSDGGRATVEVTVDVDLIIESAQGTLPMEMRTADGDWYVWNIAV